MQKRIWKVRICIVKKFELFMERCTVMNGTLAWDVTGNRNETKCIDVTPFYLLEKETILE